MPAHLAAAMSARRVAEVNPILSIHKVSGASSSQADEADSTPIVAHSTNQPHKGLSGLRHGPNGISLERTKQRQPLPIL